MHTEKFVDQELEALMHEYSYQEQPKFEDSL